MTIPNLRDHGDAVVEALQQIVVDGAPLVVGDADVPDDVGWKDTAGESEFVPYCVVWPQTGAFDGNLSGADHNAIWSFQVTSVGSTRRQAAWLSDAVHEQLRPSNVALDGYRVMRIEPLGRGDIRRDDDQGRPPLFYAADVYRLYSTPD